MVKRCPRCGYQVEEGWTRCANCGEDLVAAARREAREKEREREELEAPAGAAGFFGRMAETSKEAIRRGMSPEALRKEYKESKKRAKEARREAKEAKRGAREARWTRRGYQAERWGLSKLKADVKRLGAYAIILVALAAVAIGAGFPFLGVALVGVLFFLASSGPFKAMMKVFIIIMATLEFALVHPQSLVGVVVLWLGYFSMPVSYDEGNTSKMMEAWSRFIIGILLSFAIFFAMGGEIATIGGSLQTPILLMSLAFFATLPVVRMGSGTAAIIIVGRGIERKAGGGVIFAILMLLAASTIFTSWQLEGTLLLMMWIFWLFSLLMGIFAGPDGRPAVGVLMMAMALFIFSFQFTGAVGGELFGAYWPAIESATSSVMEPVGIAFEQASEGVEDAWLMISDPAGYYQKQLAKQKATTTQIKEEGTTKSLELLQFRAINYAEGDLTIDPAIPLIGSIVLENRGEFTARDIEVTMLEPRLKDPENVGGAFDDDRDCWYETEGDPEDICTYVPLSADACVFTSCTGADEFDSERSGTCTWTAEDNKYSDPDDKKILTFICGQHQGDDKDFKRWAKSGTDYYINSCKCTIGDTTDPDTDCEQCIDDGGTAIYKYPDHMISIAMAYEFKYDVTMQTSVDIMDRDVYMDKLINDEIRPRPVESKYSGGPVMLSIWLQDQPLRAGETSYATISVYNSGRGKIMNGALLTVKIPVDQIPTISEGDIISTSRLDYYLSADEKYILDESHEDYGYDPEYHTIKMKLDASKGYLARDDFAAFTFSFVGEVPEGVIEKSTVMIGGLDYTYQTDKELEFPVIKFPIQ